MSTATEFWTWFREHHTAYTFLHSLDDDVKEQLLEDFLEHLHLFSENVYFEIGGQPDEDQELVITAEGDRNYFDKVEELVRAAPRLSGWTITAFKQPVDEHFKSCWADVELDTEDMWFLPLGSSNPADLGIRVYLRNHELVKDNEYLLPLLYKVLDTILGEKSFSVDIDYVDTDLLPDNPEEEEMYPILQLPQYVGWHKAQVQTSNN
ncbi:hypothetical protein V9K67_10305 [Paraflavisolibacter sp. H34]|uniref:hypothetical protein n=1 Tax=Huijunlia imazamoxiresistens TaxID=3127457 RepID=UPI003019BF5D